MSQSTQKLEEEGVTVPGPTRDEVFDILSNQRRRHTLHYLRQHDEPVDLQELSQQLTAWESGVVPEEITYSDRKSVYTALQQTHLPKMDAVDIVNYDPNVGFVEPSEAFNDIDVHLELGPETGSLRSEHYLGLSAISGALLAAVWMNLFPFSVVGDLTWATILVGVFAVFAAVDTYHKSNRELCGEGAPPDIPNR